MNKRLRAVSMACVFDLAVSTLTVAPLHAGARDQSAALVLCDRVAADPADPDKPANVAGVAEIATSDIATAIKFCQRVSAASPRARFELGRAYAADRQWPQAIDAYRKAAEKGNTSAMIELGLLLASGSNVAKDQDQARALFQRAAEAGNPRGVINLTALAKSGGAALDPATARALLARAAANNSAEAEFQLGVMDANGVGGPKDDNAARALFAKAATQNHAEALDWLGAFAESGRAGPADKAAAKAYYEKAAALGSEDAKTALERLRCPLVIKNKRGDVVSHLCY